MTGQVLGSDLVAGADHGRKFHDVLEFAHVTRKIMVADKTQGFGTDADDVLLETGGIESQKMVEQESQVFAALLEPGQVQADGGDAVEEVFAQAAVLDQFFRRFGGGGHEAGIDPYGKTLSACADGEEGFAEVMIDMEELQSFRKKFPVLNDADSFTLN